MKPGLGINIFGSNRPGLTSVGSRMSSRFVESMVIIYPFTSNQSKHSTNRKDQPKYTKKKTFKKRL